METYKYCKSNTLEKLAARSLAKLKAQAMQSFRNSAHDMAYLGNICDAASANKGPAYNTIMDHAGRLYERSFQRHIAATNRWDRIARKNATGSQISDILDHQDYIRDNAYEAGNKHFATLIGNKRPVTNADVKYLKNRD